MIEIKFQGSSTENLIRQIAAFVEKIEKGEKKRGKTEKDETAGGGGINLGPGQR